MEAYPLQWPAAWPRTKYPQNAQFKVGMGEAVSELYDELDRLGATNIVVSSNMQVRLDGRPYAKQTRMTDEGVAVYFTYNGAQQCIPCDKWATVKDNVRAVGLTVAALRGLERWGAKEMVNAAFQGFKALPAAIIMGEGTARAWWEVLEIPRDSDLVFAQRAYKQLLQTKHPDRGGSDQEFIELKNAWEQAKEALS
jgi:hypothetical protein